MAAQQIGLEAILTTDKWRRGVTEVTNGTDRMKKELSGFDKSLSAFGKQGITSFQNLGKVALGASVAIAAAGAAAGVAIGKFVVDGIGKAADLESQMSRIAATLNTTKEAVQPLRDLIMSLALDPNLVVTTNEAAEAIENLAKNGVSAKDILDGVAKSVVLLANATGADFGAAADVVTDVMAQFNIEAENTGHAVDQITAVTNLSKLTFDDYRLAIAQAGGVVGMAGVSFEDFNSVLIATNANFAGGSDLGTSFKNFIATLPGKSEKAKDAIKLLGLEFFDLNGNMKDMDAIAEELNQAFMDEVTFSTQVSNITAEQTAQKKLLEQQLQRTSSQLFLYQAGVNGVGESEEANAEAVAKLNQQNAAAMQAYEGLAVSLGTTVSVRRKLTEEERIAYSQAIFGTDSTRLALGLAEAGAVAYTNMAEATKALGLEGKQLQVAQESLNEAFDDGKITYFEFGTAQAAAIDSAAQAAERMKNFKGVMEIFKGVVEGLQIMIGDAFLPVLTLLGQKATELMTAFGPSLIKPFQDFGAALTNMFAAIDAGKAPLDVFMAFMIGFGPQGVAVASSLSAVALAVGGVVLTIGMVLQPITDAIGKFVEWQDVLIVLGAAVAGVVVPAIIGMIAAITPLLLTVGGAILLVAGLRTAWESDFLGIQTATTTAINTITTAFAPFTAAIQTHMQGALTEVQAFVVGSETDFTHLSAILDAFQTSTENLFTSISDSVTSVLPEWGRQLDALGEKFPPLGVAIQAIQDIWQSLVDLFSPSIDNLIKSLASFEESTGQLQAKFGELGAAAVPVFARIGLVVGVAGAIIANILGVIAVAAVETLAAVFDGLDDIIIPVLDQIILVLDSFAAIFDDVTNIVTKSIDGDWAGAWASFQKLGVDALNLVMGSLTNLGLLVSATFAVVYNSVNNTMSALGINVPAELEKLTASFNTWVADVTKVITESGWFALGMTIVADIQSGVETVVGTLTGAFRTWATEAYNIVTSIDWLGLGYKVVLAVKDGVTTMASVLIRQMGTTATNAFNEFMKTDWLQLGKDVVAGILKGLEADGQQIVDFLVALGAQALADIKAFFGIQSPSKVFMKIGQNIIGGWMIGLETGSVRLVETAEQITRTFMNSILRGTERAVDAFAGILDKWSSVGSGFANTMQTALDSVTESFNEMFAAGSGANQFDMIRLMDQLQSGISKYNQENRVLETLKQQADLIDLIRETGGQPAHVLAGITLGRDADPQQLLDIVNRMMETFNGRLENSIRIAAQGFQELVDSLRKSRRSIEQIEAEFADAKLDQLERYRREVARLDAKIAEKEQNILFTGDTSELYHIQSLNTLRERTLDSIKRFLEQRQQIEATLARMPTFRGTRAQTGADAFREQFIDPLVAAFDQQSVAQREVILQQIDRYLGMLAEYSTRMQNAGAAEKRARLAIEGFGEGAQERVENLLNAIYDPSIPTASRDNAIQSLRDFATALTAIRTELDTRSGRRETTESIIERATGGFDQLAAYKTALADVDKQIATLTDTINETGNAALLPQLRNLDTQRALSAEELKRFLVQVSQLEGAFRDIKSLVGPGDTSAQRFVDEQIQPILDAFSAPMRPQDRDAWLRSARIRVEFLNDFIDQMRAVEQLQRRIEGKAEFANLADEFASIADIAMPETQRVALLKTLTTYIDQMERLFALQQDLSVGVGADPLVGRFQTERLDTIAKQLEDINLSEAERGRLIEQYRMEQEKILAIQQKQNQLTFLEQQLSLLEKMEQLDDEFGDFVPMADIFAGVQFGVNASIDSLVGAVSKAIDAMIRVTNHKLGIASPSKVFEQIGQYMMGGLAKGIETSVMRPINSLSGAISELPYALGGRSLSLNMGGVTISNGMDEVMFEARVRQILDRAFP